MSRFQHGVSQQEVIRGCREQKFKDVIFDVASEANHELETVTILLFDGPPLIFYFLKLILFGCRLRNRAKYYQKKRFLPFYLQ